jgi:hypothetical protein
LLGGSKITVEAASHPNAENCGLEPPGSDDDASLGDCSRGESLVAGRSGPRSLELLRNAEGRGEESRRMGVPCLDVDGGLRGLRKNEEGRVQGLHFAHRTVLGRSSPLS